MRMFDNLLVRSRGFEPPQDCSRYHLKVVRLPFRHDRVLQKEIELLTLSILQTCSSPLNYCNLIWCPRRDLNPHTRRR